MTNYRPGTHTLDGDDLEVLSAWRHNVAPPSADALASVRDQMLASARPLGPPSPHRVQRFFTPRRFAWASVVAVLALVVPAAAGQLWPTNGGKAEAAVLLESAADRAVSSTDQRLAPGQWLRVHTVGHYQRTSLEPDGTSTSGWQDPQASTFWVPRDRTGDWYLHRTDDDAKTPNIVAAQGDFYGGRRSGSWQSPTAQWFAGLPRDPGKLHARLMREVGGSDSEAVVYIADLLRSGIVPADVRASVYRVLASTPGVKIVDRQATLDGRTGFAFAYVERDGNITHQIIIDPATGRYIGERYLDDNGTITGTASTSYSVVDEVPASVRNTAQRTAWSP